MYKELLSQEELAELLAPAADEAEPAAGNEASVVTGEHDADRSADYRDLSHQYWQEVVAELRKEVTQLTRRIEALELLQTGGTIWKNGGGSAAETKDIRPPQANPADPEREAETGARLSRVERHRGQRGKWF